MATRPGRGRSRGGGRIIDFAAMPVPGKKMIGRGSSLLPPNQVVGSSPSAADLGRLDLNSEQVKKNLTEELDSYEQKSQGSLLQMTLKYFSSSEDVQFYVDKMMEHCLRSSFFVEKFTMSYKLITLMKTQGENIKSKMFSKLQTTFQEIQLLMSDPESLSEAERESVRNFCDLINQMYFRVRVVLGAPERYNVLALPSLECLGYLLRLKGLQELRVFTRMLILNVFALKELHSRKVLELKEAVRSGLMEVPSASKEFLLLMFSLEVTCKDSWSLEVDDIQYYESKSTLKEDWTYILPNTRVQLLEDIPADIVDLQLDKFNVTGEEYSRSIADYAHRRRRSVCVWPRLYSSLHLPNEPLCLTIYSSHHSLSDSCYFDLVLH